MNEIEQKTTHPGLDLTPVRVDQESFCGCYHSATPVGARLSKRHRSAVTAVSDWWQEALPEKNHTDDNEMFIQRLGELVNGELKVGKGNLVLVELGKTICGCFCGMVKDVCESVLSQEVANKMKRIERGQEIIPAKRPFYLPKAFTGDSNHGMHVSDNAVLIAEWSDDADFFQVEEIVWSREGVSVPLAIVTEYWKYQIYYSLDWEKHYTPRKRARAISRFCKNLFRSAGLPVDCVAAEVPLTTISVDYVNRAVKKARLKLTYDLPSITMSVSSNGVKITLDDGVTIWVWKKD